MGDDTPTIELLFLGSGTSAGIPMIGCDCAVCTSSDPRDRRMRASVVISYNGRNVLVDTTPELRLQCVANGIKMIEAVVFTHAHADHIMGLDDVRRFNSLKQSAIDAWADDATYRALDQCFAYAFLEPSPDVKAFRPHLVHRRIDGPFEIAGHRWTPIPLLHGKMPVNGFRVGNLAYCTDVSEIPESSFHLLKGLDVLILDALQHRPHATHFTIAQATEAARRMGAKRTYFTHIAHALAHVETNEALPPDIRLAYDGLRVQATA
ncbi:MAG TPA: MBL fold metallo-hydrolase [Tepidisphaeraceae bacterium]|jgi:phosphoribosyl 1,2-cyclic phosphate phosphodiesterase|nr:MBL fold metallo-hydrolase [Tepidisphaeraceae bacterium]